LKVNSLTTLGLVMAVGLVVDYNAHITHCFFMADPTLARVERLSVAMKTMGKSVLMGGERACEIAIAKNMATSTTELTHSIHFARSAQASLLS